MAYDEAQLQEATEILHQKEGELEALRGRIFARVVASRINIPTDSPPPYEDQPPHSPGRTTTMRMIFWLKEIQRLLVNRILDNSH